MIKLIIFDWDDVFTLGSINAYHACYIEASKKAGAVVKDENIKRVVNELWGRPVAQVIETFLGNQSHLLHKVITNYEELLQTDVFMDKISIVPNSIELLNRLSIKYKLAIVSGINPNLLQRVFNKFEVPDIFSSIITMYDLEDPARGKPYPDMVLTTLDRVDIPSEEAICIGDSAGDVLMAQAAGVRQITVLTGHLDLGTATSLGVEYILDDVTQTESLIKELDIQ